MHREPLSENSRLCCKGCWCELWRPERSSTDADSRSARVRSRESEAASYVQKRKRDDAAEHRSCSSSASVYFGLSPALVLLAPARWYRYSEKFFGSNQSAQPFGQPRCGGPTGSANRPPAPNSVKEVGNRLWSVPKYGEDDAHVMRTHQAVLGSVHLSCRAIHRRHQGRGKPK